MLDHLKPGNKLFFSSVSLLTFVRVHDTKNELSPEYLEIRLSSKLKYKINPK